MTSITLEDLVARWAGLPMISHGSHDEDNGNLCLMEKVAVVRGDRHSDRDEHVSSLLGAFGRNLNDWFTASRFAAILSDQAKRLDALGPRIALCDPHLEHELACLPLLVQVSLHIAAGWLDATGDAALMEHAATLRACAEHPEDYKAAESAAESAGSAAWSARYAGYAAESAARYAAESAGYAAGSAAWYARSAGYAAWSAARYAGYAAGYAGYAAESDWRQHAQADADKLLAAFEQILAVWEGEEAA